MSTLNARIKPKKSSVTGEVPGITDLEVAEIAVNTADGLLFTKHTDNTIVSIGGGSGGGGIFVEETQATSSGLATFTSVGSAASLVYVSTNFDTWLTFYATTAARTTDYSRDFSEDPSPGSGILAEFYLASNAVGTVSPPPILYNGNDPIDTEIYVLARNTIGGVVDGNVTIKALQMAS